jgi:hypothetical protein
MSDIEEFLKRAAAMRAQQAQQRAPQQRAPQQRAPQQPAPQQRPPQRLQPLPQPVVYVPEVLDAEILEVDEVSGDDVAAEVQRRLDTSSFQLRAQKLASDVRSADDAIEAHLHSAFEHRLGTLGATTGVAEDSTLDSEENAAKASAQPPTVDIASMLRSPQNIRNAIILSEILNPPEHRWR